MRSVVFFTALTVLALAAFVRLAPQETQRPDVVPLAAVIEKAKPVEKTVYAESDPFVQLSGSEKRLMGLLKSERLLIATGHCTAGIDFGLYPPDYQVDADNAVTVRVTEPELFGCGVTDQRFHNGSGLIPASQDLSNTLGDRVHSMIAEAALRSGILATAKDNAATRIELRLRQVAGALGAPVAGVTVQFVKP